MANPLVEVQKFGQSIWYDNIRRGIITSGQLQSMVDNDGLLGITSNPAIFEKAVVGSHDYDQAIKALVGQGVASSVDVYERLAMEDIQWAADVMHPVYMRTNARDGYVSFEVAPSLANDTKGTVEYARRAWATIGRENVLIAPEEAQEETRNGPARGMGGVSGLAWPGLKRKLDRHLPGYDS